MLKANVPRNIYVISDAFCWVGGGSLINKNIKISIYLKIFFYNLLSL